MPYSSNKVLAAFGSLIATMLSLALVQAALPPLPIA
jgi:hypothetical protein